MFDKSFYLSSGFLELSNIFLCDFIMKSCNHSSGRTIFGLITWIVTLSSCIFREKRWSIIRFNYKKTRICLISKYFIKTNFYTVVGRHFYLVNLKPIYQTHFLKTNFVYWGQKHSLLSNLTPKWKDEKREKTKTSNFSKMLRKQSIFSSI